MDAVLLALLLTAATILGMHILGPKRADLQVIFGLIAFCAIVAIFVATEQNSAVGEVWRQSNKVPSWVYFLGFLPVFLFGKVFLFARRPLPCCMDDDDDTSTVASDSHDIPRRVTTRDIFLRQDDDGHQVRIQGYRLRGREDDPISAARVCRVKKILLGPYPEELDDDDIPGPQFRANRCDEYSGDSYVMDKRTHYAPRMHSQVEIEEEHTRHKRHVDHVESEEEWTDVGAGEPRADLGEEFYTPKDYVEEIPPYVEIRNITDEEEQMPSDRRGKYLLTGTVVLLEKGAEEKPYSVRRRKRDQIKISTRSHLAQAGPRGQSHFDQKRKLAWNSEEETLRTPCCTPVVLSPRLTSAANGAADRGTRILSAYLEARRNSRRYSRSNMCDHLALLLDFFAAANLLVAGAYWYRNHYIDPLLMGAALVFSMLIFCVLFRRHVTACRPRLSRSVNSDLELQVTSPTNSPRSIYVRRQV